MSIPSYWQIPFAPVADPAAIVRGPGVRFTVLTSRLIRMEYAADGQFEDRPSQVFWYRGQPVPPFESKTGGSDDACAPVEILTEHLHLRYQPNPRGFTPDTLSVTLRETGKVWAYRDRDRGNLSGTARTLDGANGPVPLSQGLMSRNGWAVIDDSASYVFDAESWLTVRGEGRADTLDLYFFGYGHDYLGCLADFGKVSGNMPLVPRWALGNWWSRYWEYTADELLGLMDEFRAREIPLSICIVDMDWHITATGNRCSGWTGCTWNQQLFPDPKGFLGEIHDRGLKVALNLHPAEGVHPHEAQYAEMARRMDIDPATQEQAPFDIADPKFTEAYFDVIMHPYEADGIDFWWMDWQQGQKVPYTARTELADLDPLWWVNHLYFYDLGRTRDKRPFIFSRWGGLASRYAIGFSGDTVVSWASLAFQPYFTATAANVGWGWWSHDIGGHMHGYEEPELYLRWVQLGVFSPILRLHSTKNPYHDRRPWAHGADVYEAAGAAMRLRHRLIPYIASMAWLAHEKNRPLVLPMYYAHPEEDQAYRAPGQFLFGTELLVAPYVAPRDADTRLSRQPAWLPSGAWFDLTTGQRYQGGRWHTFYGGLDDIPVLAKAGAIVPLAPETGQFGAGIPAELDVLLFPGADNAFTLTEDDGETQAFEQGDVWETRFRQAWTGNELRLTIEQSKPAWAALQGGENAEAVPAWLPKERPITLRFRGVVRPELVSVTPTADAELPGQPYADTEYDAATDTLTVRGVALKPGLAVSVLLRVSDGTLLSGRDRREENCRALLRTFRAESEFKHIIDRSLADLIHARISLDVFTGMLSDGQLAALSSALKA
jgi:alpha-glucosidase (family GH31 glycosyl hydrolase)